MTTFRRGDIALVIFPNSDLTTGKKRPVIIVDSDDLNSGLCQRIVAMVSINLKRANHPSRILIRIDSEEGHRSGLLFDSVIMADNLATIMIHEFDKVIGHLFEMEPIDNAGRQVAIRAGRRHPQASLET
jgi:mRNA interferase MazF